MWYYEDCSEWNFFKDCSVWRNRGCQKQFPWTLWPSSHRHICQGVLFVKTSPDCCKYCCWLRGLAVLWMGFIWIFFMHNVWTVVPNVWNSGEVLLLESFLWALPIVWMTFQNVALSVWNGTYSVIIRETGYSILCMNVAYHFLELVHEMLQHSTVLCNISIILNTQAKHGF